MSTLRCASRSRRSTSLAGALLDPRLRRGQQPGPELHRLAPADAGELPGLEHPDQQALHARGQILDLVNEERAVAGFLQHPGDLGAVALLAPEQACLRVRLAQAARHQGHERCAGARALLVQVAREGFAPGAGLADQQHRRGIARDLLQLGAQLLHDAALADRDGERCAEELAGLAVAAAGIERALHGAQQLGQRQRLLHEIEGAQARRLDRGLDRAVTGHHDHRAAVGGAGRPLAQQRDAVDVGHPDVEQHQVGYLPGARGARLRGVGGHVDLVALLGEDLLEQTADVRFVIDHENV